MKLWMRFLKPAKRCIMDKILDASLFIPSSEYNPADKSEGGIGLSNIKQRLKLLYPDKHTFVVSEDQKKSKVILKVNY